MKALLVIDSDKTALDFAAYLTSEGCECVRYRQPLKAMDNLEEIDPQLLVLSVVDYPRHWKPFVQFAHNSLTTDFAVCLVTGENFSTDEEKKAEHLGIAGVFSHIFTADEKDAFRKILAKCVLSQSEPDYSTQQGEDTQSATEVNYSASTEENSRKTEKTAAEENSGETVAIPAPKETAQPQFMFIHPNSGIIITGKTISRTEDGIIFKPDWSDETADLIKGTVIPHCSYYVGGGCINPTAEVLFVGSDIELAII